MNEIKSKVYYDISTGEVLLITPEGQCGLMETTKEQDINIYPELTNKTIHEVDFIELEFGTMSATFRNSKSYNVDLKVKKLNVNYNTTEELQSMENQRQVIETLNNRVADISSYLLEQKESITDIEDYILQTELNKIMEGMI